MKKVFLILSVLTILFISCNQLFNSVKEQETTGKIKEDKCEITIHAKYGDSSRSATASFIGLKFFVTVTNNEVKIIDNKEQESGSFKISIPTNESSTIKIVAKKDDTVVLSGEKEITPSNSSETFVIPLQIEQGDSTGSINLKIATNISGISYTCNFEKSESGNNYTGESEITTLIGSSISTNTSTPTSISVSSAKPGTYGLSVIFFKDSIPIYWLHTVINVFAKYESDTWISEANVTDNVFYLTQDMVNDFEYKTLFVKGSNATESNWPKDYSYPTSGNVGGIYTPLPTLQDAISRCKTIGEEYTIYVDGITKEDNAISVTEGTTINIKALNPTTKPTIKKDSTQGTTLINILEDTTVNINDVNFDGANVLSTSAPAGIKNKGTLHIKNSSFSNFKSSYDGCAIYNTMGALTLEDSTIKNCITISNSDGGAISNRNADLTLLNSNFISNSAGGRGGAVTDFQAKSIKITGCTFEENSSTSLDSATNCGGAIYLESSNSAKIESCEFSNNTALKNGGAVYISNVSAEFISCEFSNNTTLSSGGALAVTKRDIKLTNCKFIANKSEISGGAIHLENVSEISMSIKVEGDDTLFKNNQSVFSGGAICITGKNKLELSTGNFTGNTVQSNYGDVYGGAISFENTESTSSVLGSSRSIENPSVTFTNNTIKTADGSSYGGAIYANNCDLTISSNSMNSNHSSGKTKAYGGAICVNNNSSINITSSLIGSTETNQKNTAYTSEAFGSGGNGGAIAMITDGTDYPRITLEDGSIIGLVQDVTYIEGQQGFSSFTTTNTDCGNSATNGSAIYMQKGSFTINDTCKIAYNHSNIGTIYMEDGSFNATGNSEILGNYAGNHSSVVYMTNGDFTLKENSSIHNNSCSAGATMICDSGAIYINDNAYIIDNSAAIMTSSAKNANIIINGGSLTLSGNGVLIKNNYKEKIGSEEKSIYEIYSKGSINLKGNPCVFNADNRYSSIYIENDAPYYAKLNLQDIIGLSLATPVASITPTLWENEIIIGSGISYLPTCADKFFIYDFVTKKSYKINNSGAIEAL